MISFAPVGFVGLGSVGLLALFRPTSVTWDAVAVSASLALVGVLLVAGAWRRFGLTALESPLRR